MTKLTCNLTVYNQKPMQSDKPGERDNYKNKAKNNPTQKYNQKGYSKESPEEEIKLAADFQHQMVIEDQPMWKSQIKKSEVQMDKKEWITPEKSKSLMFEDGFIATKQKKKLSPEYSRLQTPPRKPQKPTMEQLDFLMKQQRLHNRRGY